MKKIHWIVLVALGLVFLVGCEEDGDSGVNKEDLGARLFSDANLSRDRHTSCATCHDSKHAFVDTRFRNPEANQSIFVHGALSVGDDGATLGGRNTPTIAYAAFSPTFHEENATDDDNDDNGTCDSVSSGSEANSTLVHVGGQFHDGRASTLKMQAMGPPLDPTEMMMADPKSVVERLKENSQYVKALKKIYGEEIFDDDQKAFEAAAECIAEHEKTEEFASFDSKYDRWKRNEANLTDLELMGYRAFFDTSTSNCASCHTLNSKEESATRHEMFTNYRYENIGTPRNTNVMNKRAAQGTQDVNFKWPGLGKVTQRAEDMGKAKVPTLRNIAVTGPYMSNGVFQKLRTVLEFYDYMAGQGGHPANPETGKPWGKNDYPETINHELLRKTKAFSDDGIKALEAFLRTLTDKRYEHLMPSFQE